jgi:hypothetical protein
MPWIIQQPLADLLDVYNEITGYLDFQQPPWKTKSMAQTALVLEDYLRDNGAVMMGVLGCPLPVALRFEPRFEQRGEQRSEAARQHALRSAYRQMPEEQTAAQQHASRSAFRQMPEPEVVLLQQRRAVERFTIVLPTVAPVQVIRVRGSRDRPSRRAGTLRGLGMRHGYDSDSDLDY